MRRTARDGIDRLRRAVVADLDLAEWDTASGRLGDAAAHARAALDSFHDLAGFGAAGDLDDLVRRMVDLAGRLGADLRDGPPSGVRGVMRWDESGERSGPDLAAAADVALELLEPSGRAHAPEYLDLRAGLTLVVARQRSRAGRRDDALEAVEESIEAHRAVIVREPPGRPGDLAGALVDHARWSSDAGRPGRGARSADEAVGLLRELVGADRLAHLDDYVDALGVRGLCEDRARRDEDADEPVWSRSAGDRADRARSDLAMAQSLARIRLEGLAMPQAELAVGAYRDLVAGGRDHVPELLAALMVSARLHSSQGLRIQARIRAGEALTFGLELTDDAEATYSRYVERMHRVLDAL